MNNLLNAKELVSFTKKYPRHSEPDPDNQYFKSIKLNVPTFDGHLGAKLFLIGSKT